MPKQRVIKRERLSEMASCELLCHGELCVFKALVRRGEFTGTLRQGDTGRAIFFQLICFTKSLAVLYLPVVH